MGASYRPENPYAQAGKYRPENPYAKRADFSGVEGGSSSTAPGSARPRDLSGIRQGEALGYAPPVRPESSRSFKGIPLGNQHPVPTIGPESNKAAGQPRRVNPVLGAASKAVHGALWGGSDELAGALSGLTAPMRGENPLDAYRETSETVRGINRGFSAEHPVAAAVSELGGAVGSGMGAQSLLRLGKAAPVLTNPAFKTDLIRKVIEGGATGLAAGGTAGFLGSEGSERFNAAGQGGGLGAAGGLVFGAAAPLIGEIASPITRPLATKFSRRSNKELAQMQLIRSLARQGDTPKGVQTRFRETPDVPQAFADAGENTTALARVAQSYPGAAKDVIAKNLTNRVRQEVPVGKRLVSKALKMEPEDIGLKEAELLKRASDRARPLYDRSFKTADGAERIIDSPEVAQKAADVLKIPAFRRAYQEGAELASAEEGGQALPKLADVIAGKAPLTVRALDYMKKGLDSHIEASRGSAKAISRSKARVYRNRLSDLLKTADESIVDESGERIYKLARKTWSGEKEAQRALADGRTFWNTDPAVIERRVAKMSDEEYRLYRSAALDQIMRRLSGTTRGRNAVARINRNEDDAARLRALVGNDADFKQLMKGLDALETTHATSNKVLQNSVTQRLRVEQQDFEGSPADAAMSILSQGAMRTAANAVGSRLARMQRGVTEGTAEELGPMLTATGSGMDDVVVGLEDLIPRLAREQAQREARRRALVAGVASSAAPERRKQQER